MPELSKRELVAFDLRDIFFGEYNYDKATDKISYANQQMLGRGISATFELRTAEGRLYSSGALSRYRKKVTGGSISVGVESLTLEVQQSLFKAETSNVSIKSGETTKTVTGIGYGEQTRGRYIGVATYVPADDADDTDAYILIFARKAMFGPPAMSYNTANNSITWTTPTTTGEFVAPDKKPGAATPPLMIEIAEADSEEDAIAWCKAQLGWTEAGA